MHTHTHTFFLSLITLPTSITIRSLAVVSQVPENSELVQKKFFSKIRSKAKNFVAQNF